MPTPTLFPPIRGDKRMTEVIHIPTSNQQSSTGGENEDFFSRPSKSAFSSVLEENDLPSIASGFSQATGESRKTPESRKREKKVPIMANRYVTRMIINKRTEDTYPLPFGGSIWVQEGSVLKKDTVLCQAVNAQDRGKLGPELAPDETLISEIFTFDCKQRRLKMPATLELPFKSVDERYCKVEMRVQNSKTQYWNVAEFELVNGDRASISTSDLGAFCIVSRLKQDAFSIPVDGCLHTCRNNRYVSLRVPKRAAEYNLQCCLKIEQLRPGLCPLLLKDYFKQCRHLLTSSDIYHFGLPSDFVFKRKVTVKLPLPPAHVPEDESSAEEENSIAVMQHVGGKWQVVPPDGYRYTRTTVAFEVTAVTKFIVVRVKKGRQVLMADGMATLANVSRQRKGVLMGWLHTQGDTWVIRVEWALLDKVAKVKRNRRERDGFQEVYNSEKEVSLHNCSVIGVRYTGEMGCPDITSGADDGRFTVHTRMEENYKDFLVEPGVWTGQEQFGAFEVYTEHPREEGGLGAPSRAHIIDVVIDIAIVRQHYEAVWERERQDRETQQAESEKQRLQQLQSEQEEYERRVEVEVKQRKAAADAARFEHVTSRVKEYIKNPHIAQMSVEKEMKVLSSRSLRVLATTIQRESLTLGVYLGVPQSRIQALGVDALSSGMSPADVAYRLLVLWKRTTPKARQVQDLIESLRQVGRPDLAEVVDNRHQRHTELTADAFRS